jgi:hypothetical protein
VRKETTLLLHDESGRLYAIVISDGRALAQVNPARMEAAGRLSWTAESSAGLADHEAASRAMKSFDPADGAGGDHFGH